MKIFKKITALFVALVIVCGCALPAAAKDDAATEYVACMYVAHKSRNANLSGHTWLYFENLTDRNIKVGAYTVAPGKGVSVGTYGYAIKGGRGLYYNVEAFRYNKANTTDYIYLSQNITEAQLDRVSSKILRSGYWDYTLNCSFFAFTTWNIVPNPPLLYVIFPFLTMLEILIYPSHGTGFEMYSPKLSEIYKQVGMGSSAALVNADPNT